MQPFEMTSTGWLALGGLGLLAWVVLRARVWLARRLRGEAAAPDPAVGIAVPGAPESLLHRVELRMEALEAALAARAESQGADDAAERRLQAMAGQILGLVRDKNASLDTALAGLDQLRARMRMLEQVGDPAEARALFERLGVRLETLEAAQDRAAAALEARLAVHEGAESPYQKISDQLTRLYAQKDATVETVFARLAPLEAKLAEVEAGLASRDPAAALERFAERLEAARAAQEAAVAALGERMEGLQGRVSGLEVAENPFAEISDQLTRLYAQKDATVETVFARLAPLEAKLAEVEAGLASRDPAAALERFAERLEAARAAQEAAVAALGERMEGLQGRVSGLEVRGEPVRGDLGPADAALRAEGCDGGDGVRAARAAGGEARRGRGRAGVARPGGRAGAVRRASGGGAGGAGGGGRRARRADGGPAGPGVGP